MSFQVLGAPDSTVLSDAIIPSNSWTHVAFMHATPSFARWYIDGAPESAKALPQPLVFGGANVPLTVSCGNPVASGLIDDFRVSPIVRYTTPFAPTTDLIADNQTDLLVSFDQPALYVEEGALGSFLIDGSAYGYDVLALGAPFSENVP